MTSGPLAPLGLLAELTHRCPLACPYCSNPIALEDRAAELDPGGWARVMQEAAALGVLQVHLSGGEPLARPDLADITAAAHDAGLYTNVITSGIGLSSSRAERLARAGLDHVQISIQDSDAKSADQIAGYPGALAKKEQAANIVISLGLPLTINAVIHRGNIGRVSDMVALAREWGATRVEIAHVQYYGWALRNRAALLPSKEEAQAALALIDDLRKQYPELTIDTAAPDYFARYPKPCMGGWGRRFVVVTPSGTVLPCHAAQSIPTLEFWSVRDHPLGRIWHESPAFNAFRGTSWMKEPCASCSRRHHDFGGCRCQAFLLTGDATASDPVCHLSPHHGELERLAAESSHAPFVYRG